MHVVCALLSPAFATIKRYPPPSCPRLLFLLPLRMQASESTDDFAYGQLLLIIRQGDFSRTTVIEQSPLDIGTFLGNIGGFWGT